MGAVGWWGGARGALGPEQLVAELSDPPAAPGGGKDRYQHLVCRGWGGTQQLASRFVCLAFETPRAPRLPSFLHRSLCCPLMSARMAPCPTSPGTDEDTDAPPHTPPLPQAKRKTSVHIYLEWRGGPDGEIWREEFYPHPVHTQKSLFLTRTVFITIA